MATIGRLNVVFGADLAGLSKGVDAAIDRFEEISDAVESLSDSLEGLSESQVSISVTANTTSAENSIRAVTDSGGRSAEIQVSADTSRAEEQVRATSGRLSDFWSTFTGTMGQSRGVVAELSEDMGEYGTSSLAAANAASSVAAATNGVASAYQSASGAISGIGNAVAAFTSGQSTSVAVLEAGIVAAGRVTGAYSSVTDAYGATAAAAASLSSLLGGLSAISSAAAGSVAGAAVSVGSFAAAAAGAATAATTYAAVVSAARAATVGLSEEARGYVDAAASVVGATAAAAVGARAASAAYSIVADAIFRSSSAGEFFTRVFSSVSTSLSASATVASGAISRFGGLLNAIQLVAAAANERISAGQYAAVVAEVAATSAAFGALSGAVGAAASGMPILSAAASGAVASVTSLASSIPTVAPLAIAAAVATGRFAHELEELSLKAQAIDQMASRFGSSTEEITKLRLAAANTNVSMGQLAKGQQAFYTSLSKIKIGQLNVDSVREAKLAYDKLNISLDELKSMRPEEAFKEVAARLSEVEDPAERTAIAFDLFGKQGAAILPALKEFGELEQDFARIGGALDKLNFDRFLALETSFDRLKASTANLGQVLLIPFVEMQKAFNNALADIKGGLTSALAPAMTVLADMTKPLAVIVEVAARVLNVMLRIAGVVAKIAAGFLDFALIADLVDAAGDAFLYMLSYVESAISVLEKIANVIAQFLRPAITALSEGIVGFGKAVVGAVAGAIVSITAFNLAMQSVAVQAAVSAAATYAAIAVTAFGGILAMIPVVVAGFALYAAAWISSAATALTAGVTIAAAWLLAMGPIGVAIGGIVAVGAAFVGLYAIGGELYDLFAGIGEAMGLVGDGGEKINAATASVEELAAAANEAQKTASQRAAEDVAAATSGQQGETVQVDFGGEARDATVGFEAARDAIVRFGASFGISEEQAAAAMDGIRQSVNSAAQAYADSLRGPSQSEIMESVSTARDRLGDLIIASAQFGQAGADAASQSQQQFNELQQSLADGKITLEEFDSESGKLADNLQKNLDILANDSPEVTLKKNLELYKSLNDAAKTAGKSIRDISAGTVVDGKLFPASAEIKARAQQYKDEYTKALQEIKQRQQSGDFAVELNQRRSQLEDDMSSGRITSDQYASLKLELDSTSAQEQASIAAEEAKRTFDRQLEEIGRDISFADSIRKELETAFLSPVEKFQKELQKIRDNKSLTDTDKQLAEQNIRKQARESLVGKGESEKFQERQRDLQQGFQQGLISPEELTRELQNNADSLAQALGIPVSPSSALDAALSQLQDAVEDGSITMSQFADGAKEARDKFLESLGISKRPEEQDQKRLDRLNQNAGRLSQDEMARGRRELEASIIGESSSDKISQQRARIESGIRSGAVGKERGEAALRQLDADRMQAAGLELDPGKQLQLGIDKIQDAFGVAGKTLAEVQSQLSPEEFKQYQEALKNNKDAIRQSLGVEKTGGQQIAEARERLEKAVTDGVMTEEEKNKVLRRQQDAVRASLGVEKTGAQKIAESREKLAEAVKEGVITEDEKNKAIRDQRDSLLASLGVEKSPTEEFEAAVEKINENASELSDSEFAEAIESAKDKLLSALGIEESPSEQFSSQMDDLNEALSKGRISSEEFAKGAQAAKDSLLQSLGIPLDPAEQLQQRMKDLQEAFNKGQITAEEFARGQEEAKKALPGGEGDNPVTQFKRDLETLRSAVNDGTISQEEFGQRRLNLQAQLQEDLMPMLDAQQADRRQVQGSDVRSREGIDTFFRLAQGQDNPSLKAQLEVARNTRLMAQALQEPDVAPVVAQLAAR